MPNTNWSMLSNLQFGRYGEYYAKMEFASYGFEIYTSEVDDHGIDFIAKRKNGNFLEIQVKSIRENSYVYMCKNKWDINCRNLYLALLIFKDENLPVVYVVPATAWQNLNELFCDKEYIGLKSKPEYGLNISNKNMHLLNPYKIAKTFDLLI